MKNTKSLYQEFLDAYREMENALKEIPHVETDINVKWWEDLQTDGNTQTKLRLCRLIRNYCIHETDYEEFITISKGMIDFLKSRLF